MNEALFQRFSFKKFLIYGISTIAILAFLGYGIFEARRIIAGPQLTITSPTDGTAVGGPLVTVSGIIQNAAFFTINGRQVRSDDKGNFSEVISPPTGLVVITVAARDRFGRTTSKEVRINLLAQCREI